MVFEPPMSLRANLSAAFGFGELGCAIAIYAELLKRKGDLSEAKENLNTAIQILTECGADG